MRPVDFATQLLASGGTTDLAVVDDSARLSYGRLRHEVAAMADRFSQSDQTVVPIFGSSSEFVVSYLASMLAGKIALPVGKGSAYTDLATLERVVLSSALRDEIACLMPTSGSTGAPRHVIVTASNLESNAHAVVERLGIESSARTVCTMPLSYCFALSVVHTHLLAGASVILSGSRFSARLAQRLVDSNHATGFAGVPAMYSALESKRFFADAPAHLMTFQQAGGPLDGSAALRIARQRPPGVRFFKMYGQTEATARITAFDVCATPERADSVGPALDNLSLSTVPFEGGPEQELLVEGPSVTPGTVSDGGVVELDRSVTGRLFTGDLGFIESGYVYVTGRANSIIKVGGVRISADYVESVVLGYPDVAEAAAVRVPDSTYGERVAVVVVPEPRRELSLPDFEAFMKSKFEPLVCPVAVRVWAELPRSPNGKLLRSDVAARFAEGEE